MYWLVLSASSKIFHGDLTKIWKNLAASGLSTLRFEQQIVSGKQNNCPRANFRLSYANLSKPIILDDLKAFKHVHHGRKREREGD